MLRMNWIIASPNCAICCIGNDFATIREDRHGNLELTDGIALASFEVFVVCVEMKLCSWLQALKFLPVDWCHEIVISLRQ